MSPQTGELIALQQTALDVSTQKEIPVLLQSIVERATRVLDATGGGVFLAKGDAKAEIVQTVLEKPGMSLPAQQVRPGAGRLTWLLDAPAARLLRS